MIPQTKGRNITCFCCFRCWLSGLHPPVLKSAAEAVAKSLTLSTLGQHGTLEAARFKRNNELNWSVVRQLKWFNLKLLNSFFFVAA